MEIDYGSPFSGPRRRQWEMFLAKEHLAADPEIEFSVILRDGENVVATGSRQGSILKCIAVDASRQGEGLTAVLLTELRHEAFSRGIRHLFLYTSPDKRAIFESLLFYPVAQTADVLLMEDRRNGVADFVRGLVAPRITGMIGAVVMNCDPFTLGHRWLIETAAAGCDWLYVFVLSEDRGMFSAEERLAMVTQGTFDLKNVTVQPTGPYLVSTATFPTYFIKDKSRVANIHCGLDLRIFADYFAARLHITRRYVGTEPLSMVTAEYNREMAEFLPTRGIEVLEIPRKTAEDGAPISAGTVRELLRAGDINRAQNLVPESSLRFLRTHCSNLGG